MNNATSIDKIKRCLEVKDSITQTNLFKSKTATTGKQELTQDDLINAANIISIIANRDDVKNDEALNNLKTTLGEYISADAGLIDSLKMIDTTDATVTQYIYNVTAQMILLQFRNVVNELCDVCDKNKQCDSLKKFMEAASNKSLTLMKIYENHVNQ